MRLFVTVAVRRRSTFKSPQPGSDAPLCCQIVFRRAEPDLQGVLCASWGWQLLPVCPSRVSTISIMFRVLSRANQFPFRTNSRIAAGMFPGFTLHRGRPESRVLPGRPQAFTNDCYFEAAACAFAPLTASRNGPAEAGTATWPSRMRRVETSCP